MKQHAETPNNAAEAISLLSVPHFCRHIGDTSGHSPLKAEGDFYGPSDREGGRLMK
jgi:hypothetical protein